MIYLYNVEYHECPWIIAPYDINCRLIIMDVSFFLEHNSDNLQTQKIKPLNPEL